MMEPELDQALKGTLAILTKVQPRDLNAATPCASWDVRALVNHFVGTARWWAATIAGSGDGGDEDYTAGDFVAAYEESIRIAVAAFGANGRPAAVTFSRGQHGAYQPYGVCVLTVTGQGIRQLRSFGDPGLVALLGFGPAPS